MSEHAGLASREAAAGLLSAVLDKHQPLDQAIAQNKSFAALSPQDRAFAQRMVKTTLRRLGQIDALLQEWMNKPLGPKFAAVQQALRLGAAQLLWLDLPPHAAVHLAVEMVKRGGFEHQAGLANAVLNRTVREGRELAAKQNAALLNTPAWLWESWAKAYGEPAARMLAEAHLEEPPLFISVKENPAHWVEILGGELLTGGTIRLPEAAEITHLPGFEEGAWWVQDIAAAQPVKMLEQALGGLKGKRIADLCAAPGGKTAQLATAGAEVTAVDISANRMRTLRENLARLRLKAEVVVSDVLKWRPKAPPDAILLDAPCSATGTIRRHPDVAHLRQPDDIARLASTQAKLLKHAFELLPPDGMLAYAVCSLQPEEGQAQADALCAAYKNVKILTRSMPVSPERQGDGFFIAVMRKTTN